MNLGRLAARAVIGGLFVGHGSQKLFGAFNGPGIDGFAKVSSSIGMNPGRANAYAAGLTELGGGIGLATGTLTPLAGAALLGTMVTAIRKVHLRNGLWNADGGYEFNLALMAGILAIVDSGPGAVSVDDALGLDLSGSAWAVGALALGVAASTAAIELGRRNTPAPSAAPATPADDSAAG